MHTLAGGADCVSTTRFRNSFSSVNRTIALSMQTFAACEAIDHIIAVLPDRYLLQAELIFQEYSIQKILKLVPGGSTRQESASNAIASLPFDDNDVISSMTPHGLSYDRKPSYHASVRPEPIAPPGYMSGPRYSR